MSYNSSHNLCGYSFSLHLAFISESGIWNSRTYFWVVLLSFQFPLVSKQFNYFEIWYTINYTDYNHPRFFKFKCFPIRYRDGLLNGCFGKPEAGFVSLVHLVTMARREWHVMRAGFTSRSTYFVYKLLTTKRKNSSVINVS